MELYHLLVTPLYLLVLFLLGFIFSEIYYKEASFKKYFMPALSIKLLAGLAYGVVFQSYYGVGDTFNYFNTGQVLSELFYSDPVKAWRIFRADAGEFSLSTFDVVQQYNYLQVESTFIVTKITSLLNLLTFGNFYATSLLFAFLSFSGLWVLYRVLIDLYPKLEWQMMLAVFLVPSVTFWGSGIMKDTLIMGSLGWMVYAFYYGFIKGRRFFSSFFIFIGSLYLSFVIKFYIVIAAIPMFLYWFFFHHYSKAKDWRLKSFFIVKMLCLVSLIVWFFGELIYDLMEKGAMAFAQKALGYQWWHAKLGAMGGGGGGSVYTLGEIEYTVGGVASKILPSINVTLFRPYLYEVNNAIMLVTSVESTFFILFTIWGLFKVGVFRTLRLLWQKYTLMAMLIFVLLLAFSTGFTSYNFGALARYKIPCLPFYVALWFMLVEEKRLARMEGATS